MSHKPKLF